MTTLVLNNINVIPIPRTTTNGISIHNPKLIDSDLVYKNLVNRYVKRMAKSFNDQYCREVSTEERLENMTLHKYDDPTIIINYSNVISTDESNTAERFI